MLMAKKVSSNSSIASTCVPANRASPARLRSSASSSADEARIIARAARSKAALAVSCYSNFCMSRYSIGVDLGGTNLRVAAVDESGKLMEKISTSTRVTLGRDEVVKEMSSIIQSLAARFNTHGPLAGVGIGVPGII